MSENPSEYLKRTCLICGCHTNQTINIYEPRSGPNIVQLIQAKFKFQPLNEDKYLCFSCNNWLINWHSLQALNSNDAESPSGTFRSHLNSGHVMKDEKSSGSKKQIAICRPMVRVSPQQTQAPSIDQSQDVIVGNQATTRPDAADDMTLVAEAEVEMDKPFGKINFNKRNFRLQLAGGRRGRLQHKTMLMCACGKFVVVRSRSAKLFKPKEILAKCSKCRELTRVKANYMRSIVQVERELAMREAPLLQTTTYLTPGAGSNATQNQSPIAAVESNQQTHHFRLPKPTVDGKVVAMLRRLGTHLSRESPNGNGSNTTITEHLPQIMSPTKLTSSKWQRPLEDDEILLNFDSSISEVLPSLADQFTHVNSIGARKCLTFQVSETAEVIDLCEGDNEEGENAQEKDHRMTEVYRTYNSQQHHLSRLPSALNLPEGLSITLA
ncbi:phyllopod [Haematobia irritans]|uniref:phyllopod n=1 Tax=Haematobia irritans TaxID=7368 RepID=UPI003F50371C